MTEQIYLLLIQVMPYLAIIVFITLFFVQAGYGIFHTKKWGWSIPNKIGWILMEAPAFIVLFYLWWTSSVRFEIPEFIFFLLFELHYFQRSFVFPLLMKGNSQMPISILAMGVLFNSINGFLLGESLFHLVSDTFYTAAWFGQPLSVAGLFLFFIGMAVNLHSDHVIRNLRPIGDTRHYLPQKGMYRFVTSGNYFGELVEWTGFALLTQSTAAWIFVIWTFANLAPRAYSIRKRYIQEFGAEAVGNRKCLIPFIF